MEMENMPFYVSAVFVLITYLTVLIFYKAAHLSKTVLGVLLIWLIIQSVLGLRGFYTVTNTIPPRFILLIAPPIVGMFLLFITASGRRFIDSLNPGYLTLLHSVRVAVELVLFLLFIYRGVPRIMTFEGMNPDIISGLTAPLVFYFGYRKKLLSRKFILLWNFLCIGLLVNIVTIAILAAPFPFQKISFDQPNIAVLYFPFVWLPCCIVPLVLFSHLASIRQLLLQGKPLADNDRATRNSAGRAEAIMQHPSA
jgi:hypothetical protein